MQETSHAPSYITERPPLLRAPSPTVDAPVQRTSHGRERAVLRLGLPTTLAPICPPLQPPLPDMWDPRLAADHG